MSGEETASILPPLMALGVLALFLKLVGPAIDPRRWPLAVDLSRRGLVFGLLGVAVIAYFFRGDPLLVAIIIASIMIHEYGHVLAFRLAGHPRPVFRLAPFGGLAFSDRPPQSQVENAFVALMGPGFSVAVLAALFLLAWLLRESGVPPGQRSLSDVAILAAGVIGTLNFFNLLPFFPLDGGRTLKAAASFAGAGFASALALIMSALLGLAAFFLFQNLFLLFFALIGLAAAKQEEALDKKLPPMTGGQAALALAAYVATALAHGGAALPLVAEVLDSLPAPAPEGPPAPER